MCNANDTPYFLIERYDREIEDGVIKRIHQEDFCQAYNVPSVLKYEKDGGPSFAQCFDLIDRLRYPILDKNELLARVLFNFLIGNADAHGKNFSLLHLDNGAMELAPTYDILCTQIYDEHSKKMAMRMGKNYLPNEVRPSDMKKLASNCKLQLKHIRQVAEKQIKALPAAIENILNEERKDSPVGGLILAQVQRNIELLEKLI